MNNRNFNKPSYSELEARIEKLESRIKDYQIIFPALSLTLTNDLIDVFGSNLATQNILNNSDYAKSEQIKFLSLNMHLREQCIYLDYFAEYLDVNGRQDLSMHKKRRKFILPECMDDFLPLFRAYSNLFPKANEISTAFVNKLKRIYSECVIGTNRNFKEFEIAVMLLFFFEMQQEGLIGGSTPFNEEKIRQELEDFKRFSR